ncbi:hypothetical protein CEXT_789921 [Caerostris extrusa]|uniref:Uncharacterized protein n=1 Tax=Caerostris extrusa TaxID=172846 RepID=A0AAV4M3V1_CAEEX|nr:hypothetical protein CEXT_789921 [Caerostris extrusa]
MQEDQKQFRETSENKTKENMKNPGAKLGLFYDAGSLQVTTVSVKFWIFEECLYGNDQLPTEKFMFRNGNIDGTLPGRPQGSFLYRGDCYQKDYADVLFWIKLQKKISDTQNLDNLQIFNVCFPITVG